MKRFMSLFLGIVTVVVFATSLTRTARAQELMTSLKQSCSDARHAFALRDAGLEALAVADSSATAKLRQAAALFYRCAQREKDPYMQESFMGYYARTLFQVGRSANDSRATSLAVDAAQRLASSRFDDVRASVANIRPASADHRATATTPTATAAPSHTASYCTRVAPNLASTLDAMHGAVAAAIDAGNNDTQVLATTTARYGGAFKQVEDDYQAIQSGLDIAGNSLSVANGAMSDLNDAERTAVQTTIQAINATMTYTSTYGRLALAFERGINGSNRQLARARVAQGLAAANHDTSYTYTNGNASCYSYTAYSANCYGNSSSTTTYNNSASMAQQNAANAVAAAENGRLSYSQANSTLIEGLSLLQQIQTAVSAAADSWNRGCS